MKTNVQKLAFLFAFVCISFFANATLLLKENFNSPAATAIETLSTWDAMDFHYSMGTGSTKGAFPILVENGALTYTGYPDAGVGNKIKLEAMPGEDLYRIFPRIDAPSATNPTSTAYASFLVNISSATTAGDWFFHLSSNPVLKSIFHGRVSVKKNESNKLAFGIYRVQGAKLVWTDFKYDMNVNYLIVLKYNFVSIGTQEPVGDDVCSIIVNPIIEYTEPSTGWLVATGETGAEANSMVGAVCVRQSTNGPTATISNIRVADNWADLMDNTATVKGIQLASDDAIKTGFVATTTDPSAAQTFKVSAVGLTSNLVITQDFPTPLFYEFSTDGTTFTDAVSITPTVGEIAETTIYVRYKSAITASVATNKVIVLSADGANKTYITCNGLVSSETGLLQTKLGMKINITNGTLKVSGVNAGQTLEVYNSLGQRLTSMITVAGENSIKLNAKGLLIVKIGKTSFKVAI